MKEDLDDRPDIALHPPSVFLSALIIGFLLRVFLGGRLILPDLVAEAMGGVLLIASFMLAISAISAFSETGETLRPASPSFQLLTGGPFQYSRNPIYLAMVLFGVGFGVATENLWLIITSIVVGVIFHFFVIPNEEEYLQRRFGVQFTDYKLKTRRWL